VTFPKMHIMRFNQTHPSITLSDPSSSFIKLFNMSHYSFFIHAYEVLSSYSAHRCPLYVLSPMLVSISTSPPILHLSQSFLSGLDSIYERNVWYCLSSDFGI
jgi:hypothetical protein